MSGDKTLSALFLKSLFLFYLLCSTNLYAKEENNKYWNAELALGFGGVRYMGGREKFLLHSKASLLIKPLDFSNAFEAKFSLLTQSPLREEDGFIIIPLQQYDFIQISELWLRYQIFKNLELKVGRFADTRDETTPLLWPYYSLFTKIDAIKFDNFNLYFIARQDIFSTYSSQMNSSTATSVERTRVELGINSKFDINESSLGIKLKSVYDQYSDPDFALSSLSVGRAEYISKTVTYHDQKYRIADINAELFFNYSNFLKTMFAAKVWKNLSADIYNEGYILGIQESLNLKETELNLSFWNFFGAQSSIPPSALSSNYYPGFNIVSVHFSAAQSFNQVWKGIFEFRYQEASPYGQSPSPNSNPGPIPIIPQYKVYFVVEHAIDAL